MAFPAAIATSAIVGAAVHVPVSVDAIVATHPVYLAPHPSLRSVWIICARRAARQGDADVPRVTPARARPTLCGDHHARAVYVIIGVWAVVQMLPESITDPFFAPLRPGMTLSMLCNSAMLTLVCNQLLWVALLVTLCNLALLYHLVWLVRVNTVEALAAAHERAARTQLASQLAVSVSAALLTVIWCAQLEACLLDAGWMPTDDFTIALIALIAAVASCAAYELADVLWAAITAWALLAIGSNQAGDTRWGCLDAICLACASGELSICTNGLPAPLGWAESCNNLNGSTACVLRTSPSVVNATVAGAAAVVGCLLAGIARAWVTVVSCSGTARAFASSTGGAQPPAAMLSFRPGLHSLTARLAEADRSHCDAADF